MNEDLQANQARLLDLKNRCAHEVSRAAQRATERAQRETERDGTALVHEPQDGVREEELSAAGAPAGVDFADDSSEHDRELEAEFIRRRAEGELEKPHVNIIPTTQNYLSIKSQFLGHVKCRV